MKKYIVLFVLILIQGCSSGGDSTTPAPPATTTPIAKLFFINDFNGEIIGVVGDSSAGTHESFTITSTDVSDATPTIIERDEVGVVEVAECDVFWDLTPLIKDVSTFAGPNDIILAQHDMQLFPCDSEYTCRVENITDTVIGFVGDLNCTVNP